MTGETAENPLPAWQTLQMTGVTALNTTHLPDELYK